MSRDREPPSPTRPRRRRLAALNLWRGVSGLPASLWWLALASFVNRAGAMVLPFLTIYLVEDAGLGLGTAGLVVSLYGTVALFVAPWAGRLSDAVGPLRLMRASLVASAVVYALFPLATSVSEICIATVLLGVAHEPFRPASMSLTGALVAPPQRRAAFALGRLAINLGTGIGPAVGGWLAEVDFALLFWVNAAGSLATVLALSALRAPATPSPPPRAAREPEVDAAATAAADTANRFSDPARIGDAERHRALWRDPSFALFLVCVFLSALVFMQHMSAWAVHVEDGLGHGKRFLGLAFALNPLLIVLFEVWIVDRLREWPLHRILAAGALLTGIGFGATALVAGKLAILSTVVVWTVGEMLLLPAMAAHVSDTAPPGRTGEAMGLYGMAFALGFAVGPGFGTRLLDVAGPVGCWVTMGAIGCMAAALFLRLPKPGPDRRDPARP